MGRYDVYRSPDGNGLLLDVQSDFLDNLTTRVVVPLFAQETKPQAVKRLHPGFVIDGQTYVMATHLISAIPESMLGVPRGNLRRHHDEIVAALDMVFYGF